MLKTVSKVSSILYILTCVQCIKLFGGESEMAASNTPRNILKIFACAYKHEEKQMSSDDTGYQVL